MVGVTIRGGCHHILYIVIISKSLNFDFKIYIVSCLVVITQYLKLSLIQFVIKSVE